MGLARSVWLVVAVGYVSSCTVTAPLESAVPANADQQADASSNDVVSPRSISPRNLVEALPPPDGGPTGTLPKEHIRQVIKSKMGTVRECYEAAGPESRAGKVVVRFVIGPTGAVESADGSLSTPTFPAGLARCVADVFRTMRFDPPVGGGSVRVTYPFIF